MPSNLSKLAGYASTAFHKLEEATAKLPKQAKQVKQVKSQISSFLGLSSRRSRHGGKVHPESMSMPPQTGVPSPGAYKESPAHTFTHSPVAQQTYGSSPPPRRAPPPVPTYTSPQPSQAAAAQRPYVSSGPPPAYNPPRVPTSTSTAQRPVSHQAPSRPAPLRPQRPTEPRVQAGRNQAAGGNTQATPHQRPVASSRPQASNKPQPTVRTRPAVFGAENVNPNITRVTQHSAVKKNMPSFIDSFHRHDMNREFEPQHLVDAMKELARGTPFEADVNQEIDRNPKWGQQMQQNWNVLRQAVDNAKKAGDPDVPSLRQIVANQSGRADLVRFLAIGQDMDKLLPPRPSVQQAAKPEARPTSHDSVAAQQNQKRTEPLARPGGPRGPDAAALRRAEAVVQRGAPSAPHRSQTDREAEEIAEYHGDESSGVLRKEVFDRRYGEYQEKLAAYDQARALLDRAQPPKTHVSVEAAPKSERDQAKATAFKEAVRAEARQMAERRYQADRQDAKKIVDRGEPQFDWAVKQANDAADQDSMLRRQPLDYDAIISDYDKMKEYFNEAKQLLEEPLTPERAAVLIDAQMASAEKRVRQRQGGDRRGY